MGPTNDARGFFNTTNAARHKKNREGERSLGYQMLRKRKSEKRREKAVQKKERMQKTTSYGDDFKHFLIVFIIRVRGNIITLSKWSKRKTTDDEVLRMTTTTNNDEYRSRIF